MNTFRTEHLFPGRDAEVDADRAAVAAGQRLRRSPIACARTSTPKPNFSFGNRHVLVAAAGELHEDAGVGAAFVQLAGRVEEARTVAGRRGDVQFARRSFRGSRRSLVALRRLARSTRSAPRSRPASTLRQQRADRAGIVGLRPACSSRVHRAAST